MSFATSPLFLPETAFLVCDVRTGAFGVENFATSLSNSDDFYMSLALEAARKGLGFTSPNPMVGAVIVRDGQLLAVGHHERDGGPHAERNALAQLPPGGARGATLYVNLEPCCHHGRTPPCTDAVIESGIVRVVVANLDPDSRVAGGGVARLRAAGIAVETGILAAEGERLNSLYFHFRRRHRPYIVLKAAITLDGKLATSTGNSKWISNEASREFAHKLRRRLKAVAIGARTAEADHPRLDCRLPGWEEKPIDKLIFSRTLTPDSPCLAPARARSGRLFVLGEDLAEPAAFLEFCTTQGIDSILVEGGGTLHTWFLKNSLADRVILFYKPSFMGGDGRPVVGPLGVSAVNELRDFAIADVRELDGNFMVDLACGEALCLLDS